MTQCCLYVICQFTIRKDKKKEVMKRGPRLKDKKVWMTDDLTKLRSNLAYQARQAVRKNQIHQTWVSEGKVFVKEKENSRTKRISDKTQLPKTTRDTTKSSEGKEQD